MRAGKPITNKRTENLLRWSIPNALLSCKSKKKVDSFLTLLLTGEERQILSKRLVCYQMLKKGVTPKPIIEALNMSSATVQKVRKEMLNNREKDTWRSCSVC